MADYAFDRDTAVTPLGGGRYAGLLGEAWTIGPVPNGGYVMGLMLRAAVSGSAHPDPLTTTAHFLSPTTAGPVEVATEVVKPGRSTTTVMTALYQEGRERIRMLTTFGAMEDRSGPDLASPEPPRLDGPFEEKRSPFMQNFPENFDIRIPRRLAGGVLGEPNGEPVVGGTIAFADGRPPDLLALPVMADGFPPVAFNLGHVAWTPTVEMTVHFWRRPAPGPVTAWIHTAAMVGGYHDESGDLWDANGDLVARSRQLALVL